MKRKLMGLTIGLPNIVVHENHARTTVKVYLLLQLKARHKATCGGILIYALRILGGAVTETFHSFAICSGYSN